MVPTLPTDPTDEALARDWTLSASDFEEVRRCRGDDNRRRFAIQLCALRAFGCFVDDVGRVPVRIANHVGRQVGVPPALFLSDPDRAATDTAHTQRIRAYLGYRAFDDDALARLRSVLEERAATGVLPAELHEHARVTLRAWKVEIPARTTIERLVAACASRAASEVWDLLAGRLSPTFCKAVDALLVKEEDGRSALFRFKQYPPEPNPQTILAYLGRAATLREMGVGTLDFSGVRPDVVVHLAELARRYDVDDLKRYAPPKRYAMAACFLADAQKTALDHLVEMHHVFMTGMHRRAHHAYDARHKQLRQRSPRNLGVVLDTLESLLNPDCSIAEVARELDVTLVREAIAVCRELQRVASSGPVDELRARHHLLKRYLPDFLTLPFAAEPGSESLLAAVEYARALHRGEHNTVGADAPTDFAPPWLRRDLVAGDGGVDARLWEVGLAFAVRDALRAGDLYLPESRHHVSFWNLVHGSERWADERARAYASLALPVEAGNAVDRLRGELDAAADAFSGGLETNAFARLDNGELALSKRDALEVPNAVRELRRVIETNLPRIRIEDLLVEVDGWCGFTGELAPLGGYVPRTEHHYAALLAAVVAHGTNLGVTTMAQSTRSSPAHVVLDRLAASSPSDRLAKALTMLGRVVKTTYLLRYLHDAALRDRVHLQLNRGESRHELARRLFFANQGAFRSGDYEEIMNKVSALSVLSNAVLVWNTVRIAGIVRSLEARGDVVAHPDLARVSPLAHAHVIPSGTYRFPSKNERLTS